MQDTSHIWLRTFFTSFSGTFFCMTSGNAPVRVQLLKQSACTVTRCIHGKVTSSQQFEGLQLNPIDPGVVLPFSCPHLPAPALSYLHLHLLSVALSCPQGHVFKFLGDLAISQLGAAPNTSQVPQNQDHFFPPSLGMRRKQSRLAIVCNRGLKRSAKGKGHGGNKLQIWARSARFQYLNMQQDNMMMKL